MKDFHRRFEGTGISVKVWWNAILQRMGRLTAAIFTFISFISLLPDAVHAREAMEVVVEKLPAKVEHRMFDAGKPPEPNPLQPGEDATTQWSYVYAVSLEPIVLDRRESDGKVSVVVKYKKASIKLALPITIWLPKNSNEKLTEHEDGHRQICEEIYKECDRTVSNHAQLIGGLTFLGSGKTLEQALDDAERKAGEQLNGYYRHAAMEYSKHVSDIYDELTRHGRNQRPVFLAVYEALLRGFFNRRMNKY